MLINRRTLRLALAIAGSERIEAHVVHHPWTVLASGVIAEDERGHFTFHVSQPNVPVPLFTSKNFDLQPAAAVASQIMIARMRRQLKKYQEN